MHTGLLFWDQPVLIIAILMEVFRNTMNYMLWFHWVWSKLNIENQDGEEAVCPGRKCLEKEWERRQRQLHAGVAEPSECQFTHGTNVVMIFLSSQGNRIVIMTSNVSGKHMALHLSGTHHWAWMGPLLWTSVSSSIHCGNEKLEVFQN